MSGELIKGISVQVSARGMARGLILSSSALLLAACGGGGGGEGGIPGGPIAVDPVTISVTADRVALPLNIENEGMSSCLDTPRVGSSYMTTLYVQATTKAGKVLTGDSLFSFNVLSGFESGRLYYLDGNEEHEADCTYINANGEEKTVQVPAAFRFGTLDAAGNGSTMHLLATGHAGTVSVEFSVVEPVSNKRVSRVIPIQVGGAASGRPSQVVLSYAAPNYLYAQGLNGPTQLVVQARVVDEAGQPVPNPAGGAPNLAARIIPDPDDRAEDDALLRSGAQSAQYVTTSTVNGLAQFTLVSGSQTGKIAVEIVSDRADNNVANGIAQPVRNVFKVDVVRAVAQSPLRIITPEALPTAYELTPYTAFLESLGGVPPFTWSLLPGNRLPSGLVMTREGVIFGEPLEVVSGLRFAAMVTDDVGTSVQQVFALNVEPQAFALTVATESLPAAVARQFYAASLEATGGAKPYVWSAVGLPAGLALDVNSGMISGTPTNGGAFSFVVTVTDAFGRTASKSVAIEIGGATGGEDPADTTPPSLVFSIPASGQNNVDRRADIVMRFSEPLDEATMSTASVSVRRAGGNVLDGVYVRVEKVDDLTYRLVQWEEALLPVNAQLELVLSDSIRDLAGNKLVQTIVGFSTGGELDVTPPQVAFTIPVNGAVDVSPTGKISVVFNEAIDSDSIAPQSFAVYRITGFGGSMQPLTPYGVEAPPTLPTVAEVIAESDRRFSFTPEEYIWAKVQPSVPLVPGAYYRVVMSVSPRDMAGNQICSTSGACGTPTAPVEGATPSYSFEFRVGDQ